MSSRFSTTLLALLLATSLTAQWVSTVFDSTSEKISDDLIFDSQGNLYGADYGGDKVYKLSPSGVLTPFITGLNTPNGLAFDSSGNLFVCDNMGNAVYKADVNGTIIDTFPIVNPSGIIKMQGSDTMVVTTYAGHKLTKLSSDGVFTDWFNGNPLRGPVGLTYDDQGRLYVGNFTDRRIYQVLQDTLVYVAEVPGSFGSNLGFIDYASDCIWGTNFQNHKIYRVFLGFTDSVVLYAGTSPGSADGGLGSAQFNQPNGIIARGDSLYISEYASGNVRLIHGISLGQEEVSSTTQVSISPNPAAHYLKIETDVPKASYRILDLLGNIQSTGNLESNESELSLNDLSNGMYLIQLDVAGKQSVHRFIVKR